MKKLVKYLENNLLFLVLISQPLLDILAYFQDGSAVSVAGYVRLLYTVCIPLYVLFKTKNKKRFLLIMSVIGAICVLHIANGFRVGYMNMFEDIKYMLLVLHMPIMLASFIHLYKKDELMSQSISGLKVNSVVIVAVFFLTYFLQSGRYTYEVYDLGWTGWYVVPNAQSIIMVGLLPFIVYFSIKYFKKYFGIPMLGIIFMYVANGTKSAYYSLLLVFGGYLCFLILEYFVQHNKKLPLYSVISLFVLVLVTVGAYQFSPRQELDRNNTVAREKEQEKLDRDKDKDKGKDDLTKYLDEDLVERFGADRVLAAYGENPDAYTFADMRLKKRVFGQLNWEESDFITKLVGFEYKKMHHNGQNFDLENDIPAILYYYGYIGIITYGCLILYFLLRLLKKIIRDFKGCITQFNFTVLLCWVLQLAMAIYTGYLLRRPNVAFYLTVTLLLVYCQTSSLKTSKEEK